MGSLALITGASSGIGAAFAWELAKRGNDLILVARRRDRLEELARSLEQTCGIAGGIVAADLATEEGLASAEQRITVAENLELLVNQRRLRTTRLVLPRGGGRTGPDASPACSGHASADACGA